MIVSFFVCVWYVCLCVCEFGRGTETYASVCACVCIGLKLMSGVLLKLYLLGQGLWLNLSLVNLSWSK